MDSYVHTLKSFILNKLAETGCLNISTYNTVELSMEWDST